MRCQTKLSKVLSKFATKNPDVHNRIIAIFGNFSADFQFFRFPFPRFFNTVTLCNNQK